MSVDYWNKIYCANTWIYFTRRAGWKPNAIIGAMAYMLQEGLGALGCGTYESYWFIGGPCGSANCKMKNNQAWWNWINNSASTIMRNTSPYAGRGDIYSAFGIGLLADSNVWSAPNVIKYDTANRLIKAAMGQNKYWQDPAFQIPYYLNNVFTQPTVWDTPGCNPKTDNRSAEEWCRRLTAGYGMPGWNWTDNHSYMLAHVAKVPEATQIYNSYPPTFAPAGGGGGPVYKPRLNSSGMQSAIYWGNQNPLTAAGYGLPNCTCYAWGRFWEIGDKSKNGSNRPHLPTGNAGDWFYSNHGYQTSQKPQLGAVACFSGGYGHVAIVEQILSNGDIVTSNSAWGGQYFFTLPLSASNHYYDSWSGLTCQGFILNPFANQISDSDTTPEQVKKVLELNLVNGLVVGATTTEVPLPPKPLPQPGENEESPIIYTPVQFKEKKTVDWKFYKWTWKDIRSRPIEPILPEIDVIPGMHADFNGYVCDKDGYICLMGTVEQAKEKMLCFTPFGKDGKVYDVSPDRDVMYVYVDWEEQGEVLNE